VLSRFAGAARECGAALLVNPYDSEGVAIAINRALGMPIEERRMRHQANYATLVKNDLSQWAERFLGLLDGAGQPAAAAELAEPMPRRAAR